MRLVFSVWNPLTLTLSPWGRGDNPVLRRFSMVVFAREGLWRSKIPSPLGEKVPDRADEGALGDEVSNRLSGGEKVGGA